MSRQASQSGACCLAQILFAGISLLALFTPVAAFSSVTPKVPPCTHPLSLPVKGLPSVWKPFLLHSSLPLVRVPSLSFCLCFFFFLLPYPGTWGVSCLLGNLRSSASVQSVFCRSCSTCRFIFDVFVWRKVISMSYSSTILRVLTTYLYL